jgi:hypothetical protein
MSSSGIVQWGGLAAITGGVLWVVKGVGILLTGEQLPLVFEAAMLLFALGLLGLHARLDGRASSFGKGGCPGGLRIGGLCCRCYRGAADTLHRRGGVWAFARLGVVGDRHPTNQDLPPALEHPATGHGAGHPHLDPGRRRFAGYDQRKAARNPNCVGRAGLDAAGLFSPGCQERDG